MDLNVLIDAIKKAWSIESAYCLITKEEFLKSPAKGQCAITSMITQDYFGGDIYEGWVTDEDFVDVHHFWNVIDGIKLDLTWDQFNKPFSVEHITKVDRIDKFYHDLELMERYHKLRTKVKELL